MLKKMENENRKLKNKNKKNPQICKSKITA